LKELLQNLAAAILNGNKDSALKWADQGLQSGVNPLELISGGLTVGLDEVGKRFELGDYYLPDMMLAAEAMNAVLEMLAPYLEQERTATEQVVKVAGSLSV
jgi:methanogenic corrinoid protein MtbC1